MLPILFRHQVVQGNDRHGPHSFRKALESMMAAQNEPICSERDRLFAEAVELFALALPSLSLTRLSELVLDYCRFGKPKGNSVLNASHL